MGSQYELFDRDAHHIQNADGASGTLLPELEQDADF